jgi:hypothetical protein
MQGVTLPFWRRSTFTVRLRTTFVFSTLLYESSSNCFAGRWQTIPEIVSGLHCLRDMKESYKAGSVGRGEKDMDM